MSEHDFKVVRRYIETGSYPEAFSKLEKRAVRRRAEKFFMKDEVLFYRDVRSGEERRVIEDPSERLQILRDLHEGAGLSKKELPPSGHFGRNKTVKKVTGRYYWKAMKSDVVNYIRRCDRCQKRNPVLKKAVALLHSMPAVPRVWGHVGLEVIGPLPQTSKGNTCVVILSDSFSKWPEAQALPEKTPAAVADFLYKCICRHGLMELIQVADQESQEFVDDVKLTLHQLTGSEHRISSASDSLINNLDERFSLILKRALEKYSDQGTPDDWDELLDGILFAYRTSKHDTTQASPFFRMYNREPRLPIELEADSEVAQNDEQLPEPVEVLDDVLMGRRAPEKVEVGVKRSTAKAPSQQKEKVHDKTPSVPEVYQVGDEVLVNIVGKMEYADDSKCWDGPYVIAELNASGVYKLFKSGTTLTAKLNNNRLRKFKRPGSGPDRRFLRDMAEARKRSSELSQSFEDHRSRLEDYAGEAGLRIRRLEQDTADGNCLYHAVSDQLQCLGMEPQSHRELRLLAVHALRTLPFSISRDQMANFVEGRDLETYLTRMSEDGVWGDHLALLALSRALRRAIKVVLSNALGDHHVIIETGQSHAAPILLGLIGEHHYVSLEPAAEKENGEESIAAAALDDAEAQYDCQQSPELPTTKEFGSLGVSSTEIVKDLWDNVYNGNIGEGNLNQQYTLDEALEATG